MYRTWVMLLLVLCLAPVCSQVMAQDRLPASTLTSPDAAAKAPGENGFLQRWLILDPIPVSGQLTDNAVQALLKQEQFPAQFTVLPADGDTVTVGEYKHAWYAVDTLLYNVNLYHFAYAMSLPTTNVLFWAVTVVNAPKEMNNVRLAIGSNAASHWWLNGEQVIAIYGDRQTVIDDGVSNRLTLHKGPNILRAAIVNAGGATDFAARFLDEANHPVTELTLTLTLPR